MLALAYGTEGAASLSFNVPRPTGQFGRVAFNLSRTAIASAMASAVETADLAVVTCVTVESFILWYPSSLNALTGHLAKKVRVELR